MPLTSSPPITLHLGAHRTASSSLQRLLERGAPALRASGLAVWTPRDTRSGLMAGVLGDPGRLDALRDVMAHRAAGRIALRRDEMRRKGLIRLILSEENALGGLRENVLLGRLYPTAQARLSRLRVAVPGVDRVCLAIRSPDEWWTSAFAFLMTRGFAPPDRATLDVILQAKRSWRHVITDVAAAFPRADLCVWTHEETGIRPDAAYATLTGADDTASDVPVLNARLSLGALRQRLRDDGLVTSLPGVGDSYAPFAPDERAVLRDAYADDLAWLRDGADGLATFVTRRPTDAPARDRKGVPYVARGRSDGPLGRTG